ncbi:MAG TPA: S8 family serine peptidase [Acidiferrobacterales bacterium]|nr:S8 family serine peptidase [Acidiferrobacterales bacterium]
MRRILFVILFASLALPACAQQSSPKTAPLKTVAMEPQAVEKLLEKRLAPNFVPGEVVVKMKPAAALRVMPSTELKRLNLEVKREQTSGSEIVYRLPPAMLSTLTKKDAGDRTLAAVKSLRARPDVEYAQPNYIFQITATPNDSGYPKQWHYFDNGSGANQAPGGINLPTAWETNKGSAAVVVAVIDTGILPNHEDISGSPNLVNGYDMISDPAIGNDGDGRDATATDPGDAIAANECYPGSPAQPNSWHGTHVAGTIGVGKTNNSLGVAGINWNVKVQPVRVLGKCGGTMVDINDAIRWAAGLPVPGVPNNPTPAKVINMSLGGGAPCSASPATQAAINDAVAKGTTVVVAAGNESSDAAGFIPASCNGVITVAASDRRGYLATRYSNFGARVDIMAPGGDVRQDSDNDGNPDGVLSMVDGGYAYYNGTSMAAPHTAGVAALLLAEDSSRTPDQVRSLLKARAMTRTATQCPKPCGAGLLNAAATQPVPPVPGVAVTLSPPALSVEAGKSVEVSATVLRNGVAESGKDVAFASSNTVVFSVAPASRTTDANGVAKATITAVAAGDATLQAESQGARGTAAVKVTPKKIPALPLPLVGLLLLAALLLYAWRVSRTQNA